MYFKSYCEFFQRTCEMPIELSVVLLESSLCDLLRNFNDLRHQNSCWPAELWEDVNIVKRLKTPFSQQMAPEESPILAQGQALLWGAACKTQQPNRGHVCACSINDSSPSLDWFTLITHLILNSRLNLQNRKRRSSHCWAISWLKQEFLSS